jgi:hypothetical protein
VTRQAVDWRAPIALGVLTASGLLSALVSDGIGDVWAWIALAAPLAVAVVCMRRRSRASNDADTA